MATCAAYRSGGTHNAKILSLWRHGERGFTHGINWTRLSYVGLRG